MRILKDVEERLEGFRYPVRVAVMGCEVNGPGEAREADVGVALGEKSGVIFSEGSPRGRVPSEDIVSRLVEEAVRIGKEKAEARNSLRSFREMGSSESIGNNTCL